MSTPATIAPCRDLDLVRAKIAELSEDDPRARQFVSLYVDLLEQEAAKDRWFFCRHLVKTQDEHADAGEASFKFFPDLSYLKQEIDVWDEVARRPKNRILFIKKSRQVMISWSALSMVLWSGLFERARTIGWQSKKAEDANWMLRRIQGVWERLPPRLQARHPMEYREGELRFPDRKSVVLGLPEGAEKSRQFTWSLFVSDEFAFQADARASYVAIQPAIQGGGMFVGISSAAPSFFIEMVEDRAE